MYIFFSRGSLPPSLPPCRRPGLNPKIKHGVTDPRGSWLRWTYATHERETVKFKCVVAGSGIEETGHVPPGESFSEISFRSGFGLAGRFRVGRNNELCATSCKPRKYVAALITANGKRRLTRPEQFWKRCVLNENGRSTNNGRFYLVLGNGKQPYSRYVSWSFSSSGYVSSIILFFSPPFCSGR